MDRVFIGPWILNWWQRGLASVFSSFYHIMSAIVQKIQVWVTSPSNQFLKARAWKTHPVTVSEYVKSWVRDTSSTQTTRLKAPTWIFNRRVIMRPQKRVRPQSSGRNFKRLKRQWGPSKDTTRSTRSRIKKHSSHLECLTAIIAMKANHSHQDEVARFDTDARQSGLTTVPPIASLMTKETSSPLSRRSTSISRGWVAHWLTFTQGPSNGQLKMMMEFLMIGSSQMHSMSRNHLQSCYLHSIGPRLLKTSSLSPEELGVQHTMIVFSFSGLRGSSPRQ